MNGMLVAGAGMGNRPARQARRHQDRRQDRHDVGLSRCVVRRLHRQLHGAVWMGNDNYQPTRRLTGGSLPATIWNKLMTFAHAGVKLKPIPFVEPEVPGRDAEAVAEADRRGRRRWPRPRPALRRAHDHAADPDRETPALGAERSSLSPISARPRRRWRSPPTPAAGDPSRRYRDPVGRPCIRRCVSVAPCAHEAASGPSRIAPPHRHRDSHRHRCGGRLCDRLAGGRARLHVRRRQGRAWKASPGAGSPDADPYSIARLARTGEVPLGAGEGLAFTADGRSGRRAAPRQLHLPHRRADPGRPAMDADRL